MKEWQHLALCAVVLLAPASRVAGSEPALFERFIPPWDGNTSPDRLFRINGPWVATLDNLISPDDAAPVLHFNGAEGGFLQLSVPGGQTAKPFHAAEIQSLRGSRESTTEGYGYGYYETRMQVADTRGVCAAFFWIEAPGYGPQEIDFEFLTNEDWLTTPDRGKVHITVHIVPGREDVLSMLNLPFNPSHAMHRYGFLYLPGSVTFTVDGRPMRTLSDPNIRARGRGGFIMANETTGKADWGGGPPEKTATTTYQWIKFAPGLKSVPAW